MASVTFKGAPLALAGSLPRPGDPAPAFAALANDLSPKTLADYPGKVLVICAVPSLDTPVCDMETRRFNQEAGRLGPDVQVLVVSMDLPFAQARWCGAAGADHVQTLSDHREAAFGTNWGVLIPALRLLARAVFVVGRDGRVAYVQLVPEIAQEPDYAAVLAAAAKAAA
ncbi:MAG: thiol peroxidase [Thermodesulfobacteriota bacterium]